MTAAEAYRDVVDYIYDAFVGQLPGRFRPTARKLPFRVGLTDEVDATWGQVLDDPILGLPMVLLGDLDRPIGEDLCIAAQRAHVFAVIAAFVHERLDQRELELDSSLCGVVLALERERDLIVASLCELGGRPRLDCHVAQREARGALAKQEQVLDGDAPARMDDFVAVTVAKHSPLFPAILACGAASDLGPFELGHIHEILVGISLGLAARDEIRHWFERAQLGRSWAAAMVGPERSRAEVFSSLAQLAVSSLIQTASAAQALDAAGVAQWAIEQAEAIQREHGRTQPRSGWCPHPVALTS